MAERKKRQPKRTSSKQNNDDSESSLSKLEQIGIDQLISQSLSRHKDEALTDKRIKIKELSHLSAVAEEYLNCFILVGYSVQNEKVILQNMATPKDEAALVDLMRSTYIDIASNRP